MFDVTNSVHKTGVFSVITSRFRTLGLLTATLPWTLGCSPGDSAPEGDPLAVLVESCLLYTSDAADE